MIGGEELISEFNYSNATFADYLAKIGGESLMNGGADNVNITLIQGGGDNDSDIDIIINGDRAPLVEQGSSGVGAAGVFGLS